MKTNNFKVLAICLSVLISLVYLGCAQQSMTGAMDKGSMEKPMDTMQAEAMNKDMGEMNEQKMEAPMKEKTDQDMGEMKDKMMTPEKEIMIK